MKEISQRKIAIIGGVSLLMMAIVAGFAYGFVFNKLIVLDNIQLTIQNLKIHNHLFRISVFAWFIILMLDILVAWTFYVFFQKENQNQSLIIAWLRLFYTVFLGIGISCLVIVLVLLNHEMNNQTQYLISLFLNAFHEIWSLGLIIFGFHLFFLGWLVLKIESIPSIFGLFLIIGGVLYSIHHSCNLVVLDYKEYKASIEMVISLPMAISELAFAVWLLIKGGKD